VAQQAGLAAIRGKRPTDQPLHRSVPQTHRAGSPLWSAIEARPRTGSPACCIAASRRRCRRVGGKAAATRKKYLSYARRFWDFRFGSTEADWSSLRADDLVGFVQQEAARLQRNLGRPPAVALRAMLRFLISEGQVPRGLEAAVPMPRQWALTSLPHHLNKEQVSQVLAVCQETKPNELSPIVIEPFCCPTQPGASWFPRIE
jgi:hypothetical protein